MHKKAKTLNYNVCCKNENMLIFAKDQPKQGILANNATFEKGACVNIHSKKSELKESCLKIITYFERNHTCFSSLDIVDQSWPTLFMVPECPNPGCSARNAFRFSRKNMLYLNTQ